MKPISITRVSDEIRGIGWSDTYIYAMALLLGSMYFWSCLIQLNRSCKYNENIARTGISTLNGYISKQVALREKLKRFKLQSFFISEI